mmetsp:Transcript_30325/g.42278  ORF Transcript_30325/g.42278 Transcript_30325/m.42278 type:complete len:112 (+) Transcript_30325:412-747(+)
MLWRTCVKEHTKQFKEDKEKERQELEVKFKREMRETEDEFKRLYDAYNKETCPGLNKLNEFCKKEMKMYPASCVISTTTPSFKSSALHLWLAVENIKVCGIFLRKRPKWLK